MADSSVAGFLRDPAKQKRKNARMPVRIDGEFRIGKDSVVHNASLIDLGTGGIGITARTPLVPGDRIHLAFLLEEAQIQTRLVVSRSNGNAFGAVYESPEDPAIPAVQQYIARKVFSR